MLKVFVYGTLKPGEWNYPRYCQGKIIDSQPAYTLACLYSLPFGYPAMTPGNQRVEGFLLTFANQAYLASLDELEGCTARQPRDSLSYYRQMVSIYNQEGDYLTEAWAYFMTQKQVKLFGGTFEPSGCWRFLKE